MQVAHTNFGEAVKEVYESDWSCRPKLVEYFTVISFIVAIYNLIPLFDRRNSFFINFKFLSIISFYCNFLMYEFKCFKCKFVFQEYDSNWTKLRHRVLEEVLEPLTSYLKPFPDVKVKKKKIQKRFLLVGQ